MSKAFTRESDELMADELAPVRRHPATGATQYLTRQGAERLRKQVDELLEKKRVLLGENGSGETKATLQRVELDLQRLQGTLGSILIAEAPADKEKVAFGATVLIRDQDGQEETYQIVGADEADPAEGRINSGSPLAQALMNRRAGDSVRFKSPAGDQELTVLGVRY